MSDKSSSGLALRKSLISSVRVDVTLQYHTTICITSDADFVITTVIIFTTAFSQVNFTIS